MKCNHERRVCRHQTDNQNSYIEGHTTQWQKKKDKRTNNDLHNSTHKTKDRVTRTPLKLVVNSYAQDG